MRLGCDLVASAAGAARGVLLEATVDEPHEAGRQVARMPGVLRCSAIRGPTNLALLARFDSLKDVARFETAAASIAPGWAVHNRATVAHSVKRQGHLLDAEGRLAS